MTNSAAAEITKSSAITANELPIPAAVVAQPTPSELPRARSPQNPATIGIAAPIIVVFGRIVQGISIGGEFASATALLGREDS